VTTGSVTGFKRCQVCCAACGRLAGWLNVRGTVQCNISIWHDDNDIRRLTAAAAAAAGVTFVSKTRLIDETRHAVISRTTASGQRTINRPRCGAVGTYLCGAAAWYWLEAQSKCRQCVSICAWHCLWPCYHWCCCCCCTDDDINLSRWASVVVIWLSVSLRAPTQPLSTMGRIVSSLLGVGLQYKARQPTQV